MNGVDPYTYLNQVSLKMDTLKKCDQIETVPGANKITAARVQARLRLVREPDLMNTANEYPLL